MRHLVTLDDLSNFEIEQIFRLAAGMQSQQETWAGICRGKLLATLFYEPSTRTRLSFESAMERLNGRTLGFSDPRATSTAKGETLADTARMVTNYADLIVVRHNWAGSARVIAQHAHVPVINGGDGSHTHPTQALADLYTIMRRKSQIQGLTVGICGGPSVWTGGALFFTCRRAIRWEPDSHRTETATDAAMDARTTRTVSRTKTT